MSVYLLDINLLVALFWANHDHHAVAMDWFLKRGKAGWATCPMTQTGFVRVSSNPRVLPDAPSPGRALEVLRKNLALPNYQFWKDDLSVADAVALFGTRLTGHQQTVDAYLLGLAIHKHGVLATLDQAISALLEPPSPYAKALEIIKP